MSANQSTPVSLEEQPQVLAARHGSYYPTPPPALQRHLELPPFALPDGIRNAYEAWCQFYESMAAEDEVPALREKNLAALTELRALQPAMEAYVAAVQVWRFLGEANARLKRGAVAECRERLREVFGRLESVGNDALRRWYNLLVAEFTREGHSLTAPEPTRAPPPPAKPAEGNSYTVGPAAVVSPPAPLAPRRRPRLLLPARCVTQVGEAFRVSINVENGPARLIMSGLPPGLVWQTDGVIRGRPSVPGRYRITLTAESPDGVDSAPFVIEVGAAAAPAPTASASIPAPKVAIGVLAAPRPSASLNVRTTA